MILGSSVLAADLSVWLIIGEIALGLLVMTGVIAAIAVYLLHREISRWRDSGFTFVKGPETANYRGHASVTVPIKGTGVVALTDADLRLVRALPRREFVIPLGQITGLERKRTWKHSYRAGMPVIVVHYRAGDGQEAMGFSVRDTAGWVAALAAATGVPVAAEGS